MNNDRPVKAIVAYELGVEAAVNGFGIDCNPYTEWYSLSVAWLNGHADWYSGACDEHGNRSIRQ